MLGLDSRAAEHIITLHRRERRPTPLSCVRACIGTFVCVSGLSCSRSRKSVTVAASTSVIGSEPDVRIKNLHSTVHKLPSGDVTEDDPIILAPLETSHRRRAKQADRSIDALTARVDGGMHVRQYRHAPSRFCINAQSEHTPHILRRRELRFVRLPGCTPPGRITRSVVPGRSTRQLKHTSSAHQALLGSCNDAIDSPPSD